MPRNDAKPPECDLLVFDLDGTLIDSQQDLAGSVNATLAHLHRLSLSQQQIAGFIGDGAATLLSRALEVTGGTGDVLLGQALPFFLRYYRMHLLDSTCLYPGVLEQLQSIRNVMPLLPMAILTNKPLHPAMDICHGLGLSGFFFRIYGGNSFPTKKPDPLGMHTLMQEAGLLRGSEISAERTVLIGDAHVDVETARAAGVLSLGCSYGLDPARLRAAQPDAMVSSPAEWLGALYAILGEDV